MEDESGTLIEWLLPLAFFLCFGWVIWHLPAFMLDWIPYSSESLKAQVTAIFQESDLTPGLNGLIGDHIDIIDILALIGLPILAVWGASTVRRAGMEFESWRTADRAAVFIGRVTMMMIAIMTGVMLYEVFVRYVLEKPTEWANEMTLWIAGFVFLLSGFYAMQQRSHIRIFLLYDAVPRWCQRVFDCISTLLICVFAFALIFGSYSQVFVNKLYRWELYGSAFNPPIPATLQPMVLITISLVAIQAIVNLISDWNAEPTKHSAADDIDQQELEALKRNLGAE